jgi:8-oxo-dGTP diphosphatase
MPLPPAETEPTNLADPPPQPGSLRSTGWLTCMSDRFRVVPAAYVLLLRPGSDGSGVEEVLLQLRRGTGYRDGHWAAAAAGHVERDESVFAAAAREAAEELGIELAPVQLTPLCAMHRTAGNHDPIDERVDFFLGSRQWAGLPRLQEPDKAADLRWWPLDALPTPLVPHELFVLQHLRAGTLPPVVAFGF